MLDVSLIGKTKSTLGILAIGSTLFVFFGVWGSNSNNTTNQIFRELFEFGKNTFTLVIVTLLAIVLITNWHKIK